MLARNYIQALWAVVAGLLSDLLQAILNNNTLPLPEQERRLARKVALIPVTQS
jgi:hypothetical protein